jgi:hypothetical protein
MTQLFRWVVWGWCRVPGPKSTDGIRWCPRCSYVGFRRIAHLGSLGVGPQVSASWLYERSRRGGKLPPSPSPLTNSRTNSANTYGVYTRIPCSAGDLFWPVETELFQQQWEMNSSVSPTRRWATGQTYRAPALATQRCRSSGQVGHVW